ncbi:MAG TPA: aspartyl protease family protein [Saprospiraceae bacterium]|nr:aspartyl protease family protein [Saprospiraceae bacterium]
MNQKVKISEQKTQLLNSLGYIAIPINQNIAGQLLINAKINDVDGVYILDTGASTTVIDTSQIKTLQLKLNNDEAELTGGGLGAHGIENIPSYDNKIEISNFKIDSFLVAVMSLETAWASLASIGANDILYGIIGVDILKIGNAIIDYGTMTLYLIQPE